MKVLFFVMFSDGVGGIFIRFLWEKCRNKMMDCGEMKKSITSKPFGKLSIKFLSRNLLDETCVR